ncbi:putative diguanylate cyclase [Hyphomonas johnsonii MHS-2]|uniref:diguanylate cyclase n=1 Tax=Hyphomonas johnsonii MHS-2 TaxID=1280950 RepID=A0A059FTG4_9PROT|nr:putative diguanylate cyclase [Hyphomonas johnsonii MHS-2]
MARPGASGESADVYHTAGKVFDLIHRYRTPPTPQTYALWYAYVAGADPLLVARVDELIAAKGELSAYDIETIHWEFVATGADDTDTMNIGDAIEREVESVLGIIQQGVTSNEVYHASLSAVGSRIPEAASGDNLSALVSSLIEDNRRMVETTRELGEGLSESQKQLETLNKELEEVQTQCLRDPLTAVPNRRAFDKRLEENVAEASRTGKKLCVAMADIDHLKKVNEIYGRSAGDAVLKMFGALITRNIKGQDMVARIGGEEFAIILPQTETIAAYNLLIKIKSILKGSDLVLHDGTRISNLTASFGVASLEPGMDARQLVQQADTFLSDAKKAGRDKVKTRSF